MTSLGQASVSLGRRRSTLEKGRSVKFTQSELETQQRRFSVGEQSRRWASTSNLTPSLALPKSSGVDANDMSQMQRIQSSISRASR